MIDYIKNKLTLLLDKQFVEVINEKGGFYIAGGALTSLATNKEINDLDFYFPNRAALTEAIVMMREMEAHCSFISDKSITYSFKDGPNHQFIYYDFYRNPQEIFSHFDFTICMAAYSSLSDKITYHENFLLHNSQRHLSFNPHTKFPILSALRVQKYEKRGYKIPRNEFVKILLAVKKCEIATWQEFKNQCGQLYGFNFIDNKNIPDEEFSIDAAFDVISKSDFDANSIGEFVIDPRVVDVIVSGEKVKYIKMDDKIIVSNFDDLDGMVSELIKSGNIDCEEISLKDHLGSHLYKWVKSDLSSYYDSDFQYKLGEEAIAKGRAFHKSDKNSLWLARHKDIKDAKYMNNGDSVLLKCEYKEEDFIGFDGIYILMEKVTPIAVFKKPQKGRRKGQRCNAAV